MGNHYHLLLETPEPNLSAISHHTNASYTTYFNKKRNRYGHLFQGRYKAILIDKDAYAVELSRYIHLNPVRAGLEDKLENPLFSSFFAYTKLTKKPSWLTTDFILSYFGKTKKDQVKRYKVFVYEELEKELESPLKNTIASTILGEKDFVLWVRQTFIEGNRNRDIPALSKLYIRPTIDEIKGEVEKIIGKDSRQSRRIALYLSHISPVEGVSKRLQMLLEI